MRYADDCNIFVRSERAGRRVMDSISRFIERRLKLKVNAAKSAVAQPSERKFLSFRIIGRKEPRRGIAPQARKRLKATVRRMTRRTRGVSIEQMAAAMRPYLIGWRGYFGFCETPSVLRSLDAWIRRRCEASCGNNGSEGATGTRNCENAVWEKCLPRRPPEVPTARGVSAGARP